MFHCYDADIMRAMLLLFFHALPPLAARFIMRAMPRTLLFAVDAAASDATHADGAMRALCHTIRHVYC